MTQDAEAQAQRAALLARQASIRSEIEARLRAVDAAPTPEDAAPHLDKLQELHAEAREVEAQLLALDKGGPGGLMFAKATTGATVRGADKGKLDVQVYLELAQVPTSICHLLDPEKTPLVRVTIKNATGQLARRVRVVSYIEGYTAKAVTTVELGIGKTAPPICQLPTFFPKKLADIGELTLATLHVKIDDLEAKATELHETRRVWLLARNSAPIRVKQPTENEYKDMRDYLAAFVTPHRREVLEFLSVVATRIQDGRLDGYFARERDVPVIEQPQAIYRALKEDLKLAYVSSFIDFNPDNDSESQRVRLPRQSLASRQANCLDGAVLFASLLEAISLKPALVYVPGHALVAWQDDGVSDKWTVLDTTKMDRADFARACDWGRLTDTKYKGTQEYKFLPLHESRQQGITPLE